MNKGIKSLATSLVGSSIDFSFKKKLDGATSIDANISVERSRIRKNVQRAFEAGGSLCIALLGEMLSYYSKEIYYMAVRSSIEMRRYRPLVAEYLALSIDERAETLKKLLRFGKKDPQRDTKVEALRYFLSTYTGRIRDFKDYLTKEEYLIIA